MGHIVDLLELIDILQSLQKAPEQDITCITRGKSPSKQCTSDFGHHYRLGRRCGDLPHITPQPRLTCNTQLVFAGRLHAHGTLAGFAGTRSLVRCCCGGATCLLIKHALRRRRQMRSSRRAVPTMGPRMLPPGLQMRYKHRNCHLAKARTTVYHRTIETSRSPVSWF